LAQNKTMPVPGAAKKDYQSRRFEAVSVTQRGKQCQQSSENVVFGALVKVGGSIIRVAGAIIRPIATTKQTLVSEHPSYFLERDRASAASPGRAAKCSFDATEKRECAGLSAII
jgi:hypothetical protein